jgi:DNA-binding MarR family transcriptional regulator
MRSLLRFGLVNIMKSKNDEFDEVMYRINCLASDLDNLYHQAALKLRLSDSVLLVLYVLCENNGRCPLSDIRRETSMSKQTINSSIRKLEAENIIHLESDGGRAKQVCLTENGREYATQTVERLRRAERAVLSEWSSEDIKSYLALAGKYNDDFRRQIEKM